MNYTKTTCLSANDLCGYNCLIIFRESACFHGVDCSFGMDTSVTTRTIVQHVRNSKSQTCLHFWFFVRILDTQHAQTYHHVLECPWNECNLPWKSRNCDNQVIIHQTWFVSPCPIMHISSSIIKYSYSIPNHNVSHSFVTINFIDVISNFT